MASYTNLDDEIFAQSALQGFVATLLPFSAFSLNFSPEPLTRKGNDVLVPLIGSLTATTFSAYNICGGSASVITVSINKHKHVPIGQSDLTAASTSHVNLESFGLQAGAALGLLVFQDVVSLVTPGNFFPATLVSVVDPGTCITLGFRRHYDNNTGTAYVNLECNYGYSLGISNGARVIKRNG